jgi:hypothetical protein
VTLTKSEVSGIFKIMFEPGHDYDITIGPKIGTTHFFANPMGPGDTLVLNDSAATANLDVSTGTGDNTITTGSGSDVITVHGSGVNVIDAGQGQNSVTMDSWNPADRITGGTVLSTSVIINSLGGATEFAPGTFTNVGTVQIGGEDLDVTMDDGNLAAGAGFPLSSSIPPA